MYAWCLPQPSLPQDDVINEQDIDNKHQPEDQPLIWTFKELGSKALENLVWKENILLSDWIYPYSFLNTFNSSATADYSYQYLPM